MDQQFKPYTNPKLAQQWHFLRVNRKRIFHALSPIRKRLRELDNEIAQSKRSLRRWFQLTSTTLRLIEQRQEVQVKIREPLMKVLRQCDLMVAAVDKAINEDIERYLDTCCLELTKRVTESLPAELRLLCYEFLLDGEVLQTLGAQVRRRTYRDDSDIPPGLVHRLLDVSDPTFAGEVLHLASKKKWNRRDLISPQDPFDTLRILRADPFNIGIPASTFLGGVALRFCFAKTMQEVQRYRTATERFTVFKFDDLRRINDIVLALAIPPSHERDHDIEISSEGFTTAEINQHYQILVPALHALKSHGFCSIHLRQWTPDGSNLFIFDRRTIRFIRASELMTSELHNRVGRIRRNLDVMRSRRQFQF